jgi:hypothetical protein
MKQLSISQRLNKFQSLKLKGTLNSFLFMFCILLLITGCKKQDVTATEVPTTSDAKVANNAGAESMDEGNVVKMYDNLSSQTLWELQQARAATAKYRNIENALKDGYVDISVDIEHMGHHYMKVSLVDDQFDIRHPEILVYNRNAQAQQELIAVEYAVPLTYPMPEGFTGSNDVWDGNTGFPFWLVHAWVWKYNPDGAFNELNPLVDLQ